MKLKQPAAGKTNVFDYFTVSGKKERITNHCLLSFFCLFLHSSSLLASQINTSQPHYHPLFFLICFLLHNFSTVKHHLNALHQIKSKANKRDLLGPENNVHIIQKRNVQSIKKSCRNQIGELQILTFV